MDKIWYILTYLIVNALDLGVTAKYMDFFLGKLKVQKNRAGITYILCYIIGSLQYILFPIPLVNGITSFIILYFIAGCYEKKLNRIMSTVVLVFMFPLMCELVLGLIIDGGNRNMTQNGYFGETYQLICLSIMQILLCCVVTSFKNVNSKLQLPIGFNISIILVILLIYCMELMIYMSKDISQNIKIISVFLSLFILMLIMYMYDLMSGSYINSIHTKMMERENIYSAKQAEVLRKNSASIRKIRHDMNNHLYVLESLIDEDGENVEAKKYIEQMIGKINQAKMYCDSGNVQLDSIVNYKLSEAAEKDINIELNTKLPEIIEADMGDMVTVLGNILDNAIEAAQIPDKDRYIKLDIKYKSGAMFITLKNSYDGRINAKNGVLKTIKSNKIEHGIGLNSVQEVVQKYNGEVEMEYDDREFCIMIVLYMNNYC